MRRIKTKIIATLGPSSRSPAVLRKMFVFGMDIARLNFSHGTHTGHIKNIKLIRNLNGKMRRSIKIMQDLEGYRIRIGRLAKPIELGKKSDYFLTRHDIIGGGTDIPFDYTGPLKRIKKGSLIYVDDGKIVFKVSEVKKNGLAVKMLVPGLLEQHKGVNIPGVDLRYDALTEKDLKDLDVAVDYKLDYIAQSFVAKADDIIQLRDVAEKRGLRCGIFAKVENRKAVSNIDEIIKESDGIIVARGDLGVSISLKKVPLVQKEIIRKCVKRKKPVVVATQMLDSMTERSMPTRAEVSDVANAIFDGATHLLLSGETAVGKHPPKVIKTMNEIIKTVEEYEGRVSRGHSSI